MRWPDNRQGYNAQTAAPSDSRLQEVVQVEEWIKQDISRMATERRTAAHFTPIGLADSESALPTSADERQYIGLIVKLEDGIHPIAEEIAQVMNSGTIINTQREQGMNGQPNPMLLR